MSALNVRNLALSSFVLHGPIDIVTTLVGREVCADDPEANPIVREIGTTRWLGIKAVALAGLPLAFSVGSASSAILVPLVIQNLLGLFLVLPNIPILLACLL